MSPDCKKCNLNSVAICLSLGPKFSQAAWTTDDTLKIIGDNCGQS